MSGPVLIDTSVSFGTDGEFVVDLYQSEGYARLGVLAVDGSAEVNFVYPHQGDVAKSAAFLRELAAHAEAMANILTGGEPVTDSAADTHGSGGEERPETEPGR